MLNRINNKILIILIILIISIIYFNQSREYFKNNKVNLLLNKIITIKSIPDYRIGDIFYNKGYKYKESANNIINNNKFNNTILKKYLINNNLNSKNYKSLKNIIDDKIKKNNYPIPQKNEIVIHIRAGDVIVHKWFLQKDYIKAINNIVKKNKNINKCSIVCCLAYGDYKEKNLWLYSDEKNKKNINKIKKLLENLISEFPNINFDIISNTDIDKDICYMSKSKYFIKDNGGISKLVNELRKY